MRRKTMHISEHRHRPLINYVKNNTISRRSEVCLHCIIGLIMSSIVSRTTDALRENLLQAPDWFVWKGSSTGETLEMKPDNTSPRKIANFMATGEGLFSMPSRAKEQIVVFSMYVFIKGILQPTKARSNKCTYCLMRCVGGAETFYAFSIFLVLCSMCTVLVPSTKMSDVDNSTTKTNFPILSRKRTNWYSFGSCVLNQRNQSSIKPFPIR